MSIKSQGGVFGRNPTFNDVTVEGDLSIAGTLSVGGETITGLSYQGGWNADTNTPDIAASSPVTGQFWIVSVDGSTDVGGITNWTSGDWALYDGTNWQRVEGGNTDLTTGVSGQLAVANGGTGAADVATARTNLGLGTAATTAATDYATAAQGALADSAIQAADLGTAAYTASTDYATSAQGSLADSAVQPAAIANMLETTDIGSTVQAYDADTAKLDVAQTFTQLQTIKVDGSRPIAFTISGSSAVNDSVDLDFFPRQDNLTNQIARIRGDLTYGLDGSESGDLVFYTTSAGTMTEKARILSGGNLKFPSGNGIDFSATSGTGTSELLDDYEEGTWTPVISDGTNNATASGSNSGTYTKIGNTVFYRARVNITSLGSVSGSVRITGLPFTISSSNSNYGGGQTIAGAAGVSITAGQAICTLPVSTTAYINLYLWDGSGGFSALQASELTSSADLYLSGQYSV